MGEGGGRWVGGGGWTNSTRKHYSRTILTLSRKVTSQPRDHLSGRWSDWHCPSWRWSNYFFSILMECNVNRVLIDQGRSADVMFRDTFVCFRYCEISWNHLMERFSHYQVEVWGYVELKIRKFGEHYHCDVHCSQRPLIIQLVAGTIVLEWIGSSSIINPLEGEIPNCWRKNSNLESWPKDG